MITSFTWVFMAAVLVVLTSRGIARSRHGRALFAIREDELAAGAAGIDVFRYKVLAFVISSAWAGVAGALLSHLNGGISPDQYGFMLSFSIVVMVVLGGLGSITGAVIAAFLLTWPPELMRQFSVFGYSLSPYRLVIYPILLIILMFLRPQGLFGRKELSLTSILGGKRGGSS
jgi:branched-chain amino acid transport system permease protein